jgi:hypothetical protein
MEMPMRTAWMLLVATLLLVTVACNGRDDDTTPTATATSAASESPATATSTRTASPTATATASATPTLVAELCPIAADACSFANQMAKDVLAGDGDAVVSSGRSTFFTCPGPNASGAGQPVPLCDGGAAGEKRAGFPIRRIQSEGGALGEADASPLVAEWGGRTEPSLSDDYGTGEAKAYTIACPGVGPSEGKDCSDSFTLVFSGLSPASDASKPGLRTMLVLDVARDDDDELKVVGFVTGVLTSGLDLALHGGSGSMSDANVQVLAPLGSDATSVTFFPWDPSALTG